MPIIERKIQGNFVGVGEGILTDFGAEAIVVPQYNDRASYCGQNMALLQSPAKEGMKFYNTYVREHGDQAYGTVIGTAAVHNIPLPVLLHAVMIRPHEEAENGKSAEFKTVQTCTYNALVEAEKRGLRSIAFPALGNDILGHLSARQSAQAMMSAIATYAAEGHKPLRISFIVPQGDVHALSAFNGVLLTGDYVSVDPQQRGNREVDLIPRAHSGEPIKTPTVEGTLIGDILKGEALPRVARRLVARQRSTQAPRQGS